MTVTSRHLDLSSDLTAEEIEERDQLLDRYKKYLSVTAHQASRLLGVDAERIEIVLPAHWRPSDLRKDSLPRAGAVPRYNITSLIAVKEDRDLDKINPLVVIQAEKQMNLLMREQAPTRKEAQKWHYTTVEDVLGRDMLLVGKFSSREAAEELLRLTFIREVAWSPDDDLQEGMNWCARLAYGNLEKNELIEEGVELSVLVPPCPQEQTVAEYRDRVVDGLMLALTRGELTVESVDICSGYVLDQDKNRRFEKAAKREFERNELLKEILTYYLQGLWKGKREELTERFRTALVDVPIAATLPLEALVYLGVVVFRRLDEIRALLDLGPAPDPKTYPTPNLYGTDPKVWSRFLSQPTKVIYRDGRWLRAIKLESIGRMLGLQMVLSSRGANYSLAVKKDGTSAGTLHLNRLLKKARRLMMDITTGEWIDQDIGVVDPYRIFAGLARGILQTQEKKGRGDGV